MLDQLHKSFLLLLLVSMITLYVAVGLHPTTTAGSELDRLDSLLNRLSSNPQGVLAEYRQDWISDRTNEWVEEIKKVEPRTSWARQGVANEAFLETARVASRAALDSEATPISQLVSDLEGGWTLKTTFLSGFVCRPLVGQGRGAVRISKLRSTSSGSSVRLDVTIGAPAKVDGNQALGTIDCDVTSRTMDVAPLGRSQFGQAFPVAAAEPGDPSLGMYRSAISKRRGEVLERGARIEGVEISARYFGVSSLLLTIGLFVYQLGLLRHFARYSVQHQLTGSWICLLPNVWAMMFAILGGLILPFTAVLACLINLAILPAYQLGLGMTLLAVLQGLWFVTLLDARGAGSLVPSVASASSAQ
jgi:hypothetical protein